ncbi:MAG: aminopeptidase [Phycisphaerae bacterium]
MTDPRVTKLAKVLVDYSLNIKKGQHIMIVGSPLAADGIRELYRLAIERGGHVEVQTPIEGLGEIFYKTATKAQLEWVNPVTKYRTKKIDGVIRLLGDANTRDLTGCDPKKMATFSKAHESVKRLFMKRSADGELHWSLTQWPTHANAQDADMSLSEYEDFVFAGGKLLDSDPVASWKALSKAQAKMVRKLNKAKEVRIVAEDTDITFNVTGRKWINCDGKLNFPDGEVFTGPVEDGVNGYIRYSFPAVHGGREVTDVFLEFEKGKVARATASKGEDFLKAMIDMDKGSSRLGELAFGTNYDIQQYTRNTLFDEKIGGTVHLALGSSYPETGATNESGLHWDMVCDTRKGGEIHVDDEVIARDGRFLDSSYPQPKTKTRKRSGTSKTSVRKKTSRKKSKKSAPKK